MWQIGRMPRTIFILMLPNTLILYDFYLFERLLVDLLMSFEPLFLGEK
jgi:hypothetical protein